MVQLKSMGQRIKERRESLRLTQEELAARIEGDQKAVWRYESGEGSPSIQKLILIAKALDTSTDWLLGTTDDPEPSILSLDENEKRLINIYRKKPSDRRELIITVASAM
jgi:transcriptional regulator with XRE-family HTH domain